MAWVRLSDDFYDHPKIAHAGALGVALFAAALAWSNRNLTDGFIPRRTASRLLDFEDAVEAVRAAAANGVANAVTNAVTNSADNEDLTPAVTRYAVRRLVSAGLWEEVEGGYQIHDYLDYQASREQIESGRAKNRARQKAWKAKKAGGDGPGDGPADTVTNAVTNAVSNGVADSRVTGAPNPNPNTTEEELRSSSSSEKPDDENNGNAVAEPVREDVQRICQHLADRIVANGGKRPTIGKRWHDSARLLLDRDGRTEEQVHAAIDWCQNDEFWRSNILSMSKLREKYDQLRLQAERQRRQAANVVPLHQQNRPSTTDARVAAGLDLAAEFRALEGNL